MTARSTTMTMSRRQVLARTGALVTGAAAGWLGGPACLRAAPGFTCPPLPYAEHALAPYLLAPTVSVHYGHHHRDAVNNLNTLVQGTALADMTLEDVIRTTAGDPRHVEIFNNAAQAWNHMFYWHSMRPGGGGVPAGTLRQQIEEAFCGLTAFKNALMTAATTLCGSGWVWLVVDRGTLKVRATSDAVTPFVYGQIPLFTIDVWEHAYDLDYQSRRADYITAFLEHLVHWDFVAENLAKA